MIVTFESIAVCEAVLSANLAENLCESESQSLKADCCVSSGASEAVDASRRVQRRISWTEIDEL